MYGDTGVMRRRVAQLREQGSDVRALAERLVAQMEAVAWTGRAADTMRSRIRERAGHLRDVATRHDEAATSLERHVAVVDELKERIATTERKVDALVTEAGERVAGAAHALHDDGVGLDPSPEDRLVAAFTPPPTGHRDWLDVDLPGLR